MVEGDLKKLKEIGLVTIEEESLWAGHFEAEEKAQKEIAFLEDRKPTLSRMLADAKKEAESLRAERPQIVMEFAMSGDRKALADQRAQLRNLGEAIEDLEAALSAVNQKIAHGFTGIFSHSNLARTKIEGRIRGHEEKEALNG